jgi:glycosyltransferase involved in cell wall biosynthesis
MSPPALSVIVVSINHPSLLRACLRALEAQADDSVELVVVAASGSDNRADEALRRQFRRVRWLEAPADATVPQLRAQGVHASSGPVVALIEDDCVVSDGWCRAILDAHRGPEVAIGGAVEPGSFRHARDWAVYFCEYGRFMGPMPADARLSGTNVSYKREVIAGALGPEGLNDVLLHWAWTREGRRMRADSRLSVRNVNSWPRTHLTAMPFHHGRAFAAHRFAGLRVWQRVPVAAATVFLPGLQVARMIATVLRRQRHLVPFVKAIPGIMLFTCSWSAGELAGCLLGDRGSSSQWR